MATEKRSNARAEQSSGFAPGGATPAPPTDWTVEKLVGLGALTLITFLSFIYFVSP